MREDEEEEPDEEVEGREEDSTGDEWREEAVEVVFEAGEERLD